MDTQWPRYYVFEKANEDTRHQYVGTVHAPDPELALQNARDVFARRPSQISIWVVRSEYLSSKTLTEQGIKKSVPAAFTGNKIEDYYVFRKEKPKAPHVNVGVIKADNPEKAIAVALETFPSKDAMVWWVFPVSKVATSEDNDPRTLLGSASDKEFRHQSHYPVVTLMRKVKLSLKSKNDNLTDLT